MMSTVAKPPALLIDFGGVLTESVLGAFERACLTHGVDPRGFIAEAFASDHAEDSPFALIELGRISIPEFVEQVSPVLSRHASATVDGAAWYDEVQRTTQRVDALMVKAVQELVDLGIQTALVSNSWGPRDTYPWDRMPRVGEIIVSAEVGIRKPDPAIYLLAADKLGRPTDECIFVDDVEVNLVPARNLGMQTLLHTDRESTLTSLRRVYG
ncbi:hydrolase [Mycolicibacter sinensis]|uniref:Hydrolase n=1 Tax=Mycolicibacter sinensis (strain JDM601) TaxID=875328 RepID=F5YRL7_MYCSD|nr:HAD family phosphatase [Mycolicibacter sinensis]AEF37808.1 hydrolase [Mycolicibacter sinensis]